MTKKKITKYGDNPDFSLFHVEMHREDRSVHCEPVVIIRLSNLLELNVVPVLKVAGNSFADFRKIVFAKFKVLNLDGNLSEGVVVRISPENIASIKIHKRCKTKNEIKPFDQRRSAAVYQV